MVSLHLTLTDMCTSPIIVKVNNRFDSRTPLYREVPCGKCCECLKQYQNGWKIRLTEEARAGSYETVSYIKNPDGTRNRITESHNIIWDSAAFLTLTYRDTFDRKTLIPKRYKFNRWEIHSHFDGDFLTDKYYSQFLRKCDDGIYIQTKIPYVQDTNTGEVHLSVSKLHVQNWLKRFRIWYTRKYGKSPVFKYFYCTEYGPRTLRPHAHCVFYGLTQESIDYLRDDWYLHHGHVDFSYFKDPKGILEPESLEKVSNYVSKYCAKGVFFENPLVADNIVEKPIRCCSKGIGIRYIREHYSEYMLEPLGLSKVSHIIKNPYDRSYFSNEWLSQFSQGLYYRSFCNPQFKYRLPRYYLEKIFGDRTSPLRLAYSGYLLSINAQLLDAKLRQILSENPSWTYFQAYHFFNRCEIQNRANREKNHKDNLTKFYLKSKL